MIFRSAITIILLIASTLALADDALDLSLNNNAIAFEFSASTGALMQKNANFYIGMLYDGDTLNSLVDAGLLVKGDAGDSGFALSLGAKILAGSIHNDVPGTTEYVSALVIGGELGYAFPAAKNLSVALDLYAAPTIMTFADASGANQWALRLEYEVNQGAKVYAEYRGTNFAITSTGNTVTLESGNYMGLKLAF